VISKINVDTNPELAAQFKVRSIPALFYFKKGEIVGTQNEYRASRLTSHLTNIIKLRPWEENKHQNLPTGYQSLITNGRRTIVGDEPKTSAGTDFRPRI
jgi:thioredoxin-like negative regulator of GroEL